MTVLPNGWKKVKLGDVVKMSSGGTPSKDNASFWNGDIPWISALEMHKNFVEDAKLNITKEALKKGSSLAKKNDLLLLTRGSMLWKRIPVCLCLRDVAFNQDVKCLHTDNKLNSTFLLYWFGCMESKIMHMVVGTGIGAGKLESSGILDLDVNLPPLEEQKKIAATLSVWDSAIEKMEKLIEAKIVQKNSLTCKLIEKSSEAKFKLENVTIDKSKWGKKKFKDVFEFLPTNTYSRELMSNDEGSIKNIHYGDVLIKYAELLDVSSVKIPCLKSSVDSSKMIFLQSGDIVIADTAEDETVGKAIEILNIEDHLVVSGLHTMLCRPQKEMFYHGWLGYYINSKEFHRQLIPLITGIKVSSIAKKDIIDTFILIPSLQEQKIIVETLSETNKELSLLKQQLENYKKQKQGLMQKLLTGQWRMK